jgi:hypothetical protein
MNSKMAVAVVAAGIAIGCGGGNITADGSATTGVGGSVGTGTGGNVGTGTGGSASSTCAVPTRTPNLEDCTEFAPTGAVITPDRAVAGDGGIYLPGGELALPAGGTLIDGDYDLVRAVWGTTMRKTQRTIRISNGGTFFEWVIDQDDPQSTGVIMHYRFNTTMSVSGTTISTIAIGCGGTLTDMFGFTAAGDELSLFNLNFEGLFVYKRNCRR